MSSLASGADYDPARHPQSVPGPIRESSERCGRWLISAWLLSRVNRRESKIETLSHTRSFDQKLSCSHYADRKRASLASARNSAECCLRSWHLRASRLVRPTQSNKNEGSRGAVPSFLHFFSGLTARARLSPASDGRVIDLQRRRSESNRRIADLQSAALPLGHGAEPRI